MYLFFFLSLFFSLISALPLPLHITTSTITSIRSSRTINQPLAQDGNTIVPSNGFPPPAVASPSSASSSPEDVPSSPAAATDSPATVPSSPFASVVPVATNMANIVTNTADSTASRPSSNPFRKNGILRRGPIEEFTPICFEGHGKCASDKTRGPANQDKKHLLHEQCLRSNKEEECAKRDEEWEKCVKHHSIKRCGKEYGS